MKMEINETKNCQATAEILETLGEKFLKKFDNLVNVIKDQGNNSVIQNNEFLYVLHRIDSKLECGKNESRNGTYPNCAAALVKTRESGIYTMKLSNFRLPFPVYCDDSIFGGNWTVIQRRQDGSLDFYRSWTEYQNGFGNLHGEFFIGLDKLHALTERFPQELLIELEDFDREIRYAKYSAFAIGGQSEDYALNVLGSYSGNANDSLSEHKNMKFSTKGRDNTKNPTHKCAEESSGAWWYKNSSYCHLSNLNGLYLNGEHTQYNEGIEWYYWRRNSYSYKRVQMLIRPRAA